MQINDKRALNMGKLRRGVCPPCAGINLNLTSFMPQKKSKKRLRRDQWIKENGPCIRCGSDQRLEVDHIDPAYKTIRISEVWLRSEQVRTVELLKCQVLCHDCHYSKTAKENGWAPKEGMHGLTRYCAGCRCDICRAAKAKEKKAYLARKKMKASV